MRGQREAELYRPHIEGRLLAISFITVGEMYYGAEKAGWDDRRRKQLESTLRNFVVIPYDNEIARFYGQLMAERKRKGLTIHPNDGWIAACTLRHEVPLVTHNYKDFKEITGLEVIHEETE
jgi:tRNA(fMet)-specific endonuclease VapC